MKKNIFFISFLLIVFLGVSQNYAPKEYYLVDSLAFNELSPSDQKLIDSVLQNYHQLELKTDKLQTLNTIVEYSWDDRVWPKYNKWILDDLENRKSDLDSINQVLYAGCLINQGYFLRLKGDIEKALHLYEKSYNEYEKLNNKEGLAFCLNNIGVVYDNLGDLPKALEYYHKSLAIQEEIQELEGEANSLSNIGEVHRVLNDLDKALEFFQKSLSLQKEIKNRRGEAMILIKIGDVYYQKNDYQKAQEYFNESLQINQEIEDGYGIASSLMQIGNLLFLESKNEEALTYVNKSLLLFEQFQDKEEIAKAYNLLGKIYFAEQNLQKSKQYNEKAYKMAEELGFTNLISSIALNLSAIYETENNSVEAYKYYKTHIKLRDSTRNEKNKKVTIRMQLQHDYEKQKAIDDKEKEKQIAVAYEAKKRQQIVSIAFAGVGFLTIVFIVILYNRLKITKKQKEIIAETNEELNQTNEEILAQRDEIEEQKHLLETKNNEITSSISYAKGIQEAILPPMHIFKKYFNDSFVLYKPKDVVAGDFYWLEVVDDTVFFAAADCTGHGVPGAMVSVVCNGALNRSIREYKLTSPAKILDKTRELVINTFEKSETQVKDGMDICLCAWNKKTSKLQYAGANNNLYLLKNKEIEIIKANREPVGYVQNPHPFTNYDVDLTNVQKIYLFTDGFVDQFGGPKSKKYGYNTFRQKLIELARQNMDVQKEILEDTFDKWKGYEEQIDDVCIIGVRL